MSSFDDLAKRYAKSLLNSTDRFLVADRIVREIENLIYSDSKTKLTNEDKKRLTDLIYYYLKNPSSSIGYTLILEKSDNKDFLSLINYINGQLTGDN